MQEYKLLTKEEIEQKSANLLKSLADFPYTIQGLVALIRWHKRAYYNGFQEITDSAYDALEARLKEIDPNHPVLSEVGTK